MLEKIIYIGLYVSDQEKALDYYTNVVGFEKRVDSPTADGQQRFVTVGVNGQDFELVLWPGRPGRGGRLRAASRRSTRSPWTMAGRRTRS